MTRKHEQAAPARARSPTGQKSENRSNILLYALQCSQRIATWLTWLAVVHNLGTSIAVVLFPAESDALTDVLETCQPLYKIGISAYFGKAAVENVLKIQKSVSSIKTYADVDEDDDDDDTSCG
jgi:hypothetical protein